MFLGLWLLIIFTIIYEPIIGYFGYQRFKHDVKEKADARLNYYKNIMIGLWLPTLFIFLLVSLTGMNLMDIGIALPNINLDTLGTEFTYTIIIAAVIYMLIFSYYLIGYRFSSKLRMKFIEAKEKELNAAPYADILPVTNKEKKLWDYVSLTAGVTEEIIYRGFLIFAFSTLFPDLSIWLVILLSSMLFGLAHTYQGFTGVIRTSIIGIFFSCIYIGLNSILPLILIHFLMDYVAKLGDSPMDQETNIKTS
ncbi:CPBP family intramembrane metalloprotease [Pradoshia eiseniae]|uniref:CPBP family intramembrane metalloprotease n=1 Tax=Pradoshia eiseniae TaxID=2064768 RepID=A0A2S7N3U3_9BACI|nr:CPBP family intramembrane glutamic endopeptidase [Pradoshia eiseniae]PQD96751.1 CPBP family intramembrane metalloprotease [Pradoshia eiseniae]